MDNEAEGASTTGQRTPRERVLSLPAWFTAREKRALRRPEVERPFGEGFPLIIAFAFCAAGVYLTVAAIAQLNGGPS